MSQENVERAKEVIERFNRGGEDDAVLVDLFDPDAVWHSRADEPDTGVYRGHDAIREMFRMWRDTLEDARAEIEEFIDAGDAVVAPCWFCGGRHSGAQVREPYTYVMKWLDGQIVEWREYQTKPDALEAVGLKE